jgi:hypothetical protein
MEHLIGSHMIRDEGNIAVVIFNGSVTAEDMQRIFSVVETIIERHGRYGTLVNACSMGRVTPGARQVIGQWPRSSLSFGISVFGASLVTRTVMTLVIRALHLVGRGPVAGEFFKTEAEARAWITARSKQATAAQQAGI